MLVLSRKIDEKIRVGKPPNEVTVMVVYLRGDRVGLGIEAQPEVPIIREELLDTPANVLTDRLQEV